ncbi:hypothetical protein Fmac_003321 [Flemingia macrophylla]|uniref:Uncharacterized protein n=1 Tax=Flemingia macrophylla TaxID=520843 RepID=A0ABD1NN34_9FABA
MGGRDGGPHMTSLRDVVTAARRVRVECGLRSEAFMHREAFADTSEKLKGQLSNWVEWVEVLVTEICFLCIRRNLVDRMLELPWNYEEEKSDRAQTRAKTQCL